ncbi:MAG: hypothetical protein U0L11_04070 [Acutalibacteraceae bacterium]|nr:hypothetical protein [Acutalibacteraceae bacterium]
MTGEQFTKYQSLKKEIEPLISFLKWCGKRYKNHIVDKFPIRLIKKEFRIGRKGVGAIEDTIVEIPFELQDRIVDVIEQYIDEKQNELEKI